MNNPEARRNLSAILSKRLRRAILNTAVEFDDFPVSEWPPMAIFFLKSLDREASDMGRSLDLQPIIDALEHRQSTGRWESPQKAEENP